MSFHQSPVSLQDLDSVFDEDQWSDKKDRQLRLWGLHGQKRIDQANVLLLNATAVGCEVLKNIVLPGFGHFTIVDDKVVGEEDLGANFFVRITDLGHNRAEAAVECLCELNPEVQGSFLKEDPLKLFMQNPQFFDNYNYVVASQILLHELRPLASYLYERNIPLVIVFSIGMIGYVRVVKRIHTVTEAKLDNEIDDLRLYEPWDELLQFANEQVLDQMGDIDHSHTPYPIILLHALKKWKESHGNTPSNRNEEEEFLGLIRSMKRPHIDETNFDEAAQKSYYAYQRAEIPEDVQQIFNDPETMNLTANSEDFFIMARALKLFIDNEGQGQLPLQGRVPDFHSDTERYIKLQDIYKKKNRADMAIVKSYVQNILRELGRDTASISDLDIKEFCKNAFYLRVFHLPSIESEFNAQQGKLNTFYEHTWNPESPVAFYFMLRALDIYVEKYQKYPGSDFVNGDEPSSLGIDEIRILSAITEELVRSMGMNSIAAFEGASQFDGNENDGKEWTRLDDFSREFARYGAAEIHNISALIGGVGGQELIKLCTHQRFPVTCFIYDGIHGTSVSLDL